MELSVVIHHQSDDGPFKLQVVGDDGTWLDAANDEGVMRFASAADARIEGRWSFATNIVDDTGNPLRDWRVACVVESAAHRFEPGNIRATNTIAAAWAEEPAFTRNYPSVHSAPLSWRLGRSSG